MTGSLLEPVAQVGAAELPRLRKSGAGVIILVGAARSGRRTRGPHASPAAPLPVSHGDGPHEGAVAKDATRAGSADHGLSPFQAMLEYAPPSEAALLADVYQRRRTGASTGDAVVDTAKAADLRRVLAEQFTQLWRNLCDRLARGELVASGVHPRRFQAQRQPIPAVHWTWPNAAMPFGQATRDGDPPSVWFGNVLMADVRILPSVDSTPVQRPNRNQAIISAHAVEKLRHRGLAEADKRSVKEAFALMVDDVSMSAWEAAKAVAPNADGAGTVESKAKRLLARILARRKSE